MITDPVTMLWQLLRQNETKDGNFLTFRCTWIKPGTPVIRWEGLNEQTPELAELYRKHGLPTTISFVDSRTTIPPTYRCNICGGLVNFDGTPPGQANEPQEPVKL